MTLLAPALALGGALAFLAGCASDESHVVSAPPPPTATTVVTTQTTQTQPVMAQAPASVTVTPAPNPPASTIIVTQAIPAPQEEAVLARPSGDYEWVPGYWTWRDSRYLWMAGHWEIPPYRGAKWVPPYTEPEGNAFRFHEGHWN